MDASKEQKFLARFVSIAAGSKLNGVIFGVAYALACAGWAVRMLVVLASATEGWYAGAVDVASHVVVDQAKWAGIEVRLAEDVEDAGAMRAINFRRGQDHALAGGFDEVAAGVTACALWRDTIGWKVASDDFWNLSHYSVLLKEWGRKILAKGKEESLGSERGPKISISGFRG